MHCVLQVKESSESNQQPVIVCTNQVLSEAEANVMRTNSWLYHYYSVQNKLQYGLAYDVGPSTRLLYYPEHHQTPEFVSGHEHVSYGHLTTMPGTIQPHLTHHSVPTHAHHNQHHHHHRRADSEPVDYSYSKRKPKDFQNLELEVGDVDAPDAEGGSTGLLIVSHVVERPRALLKVQSPTNTLFFTEYDAIAKHRAVARLCSNNNNNTIYFQQAHRNTRHTYIISK